MATYKVIQDIEAEDKLVGPLTLRQCIYAAVACLSLYICFLALTKGAAFLLIFFLPIAAGAGFFAFPWAGEQPTEIWALARLRFMLKPRVRIWDQDGVKDLVTVLAPKRVEIRRSYKESLTQREVNSRLKALADTIDSRGWATRNAAYGIATQWNHPTVAPVPGSEPVAPSTPNDDIFDPANSISQNFDAMLSASSAQQRQRVISQLSNPNPQYGTPTAAPQPTMPAPMSNQDYRMPQLPAPVMPSPTVVPQQPQPTVQPQQSAWFTSGPAYPTMPQPANQQFTMPEPQQSTQIESDMPLAVAATPTAEDSQQAEAIRQQNDAMSVNYNHMRVLQPSQSTLPANEPNQPSATQPYSQANTSASASDDSVTHTPDPAILELANNDDLDIATIARQASKQIKQSPDEVEIRLH